MSESWLSEWLLGKGGRIYSPKALDLFLRANNMNNPLQSLWVPPVAVPVILTNPTGEGSAQWYDRNPTTVLRFYNSDSIAQHGLTDRWTYTVSAGKKAFVESLFIRLVRNVAVGAPPGVRVLAHIALNIVGGVGLSEVWACELVTGLAGEKDSLVLGQSITLKEDDVITAQTVDPNGTGSVNYCLASKITEFDA
jgi:hypothetical protein